MEVKICRVNAFTEETFGGNPAGVVLNINGLTDNMMQSIAKEINLSETAFITPLQRDNFDIRFFTPMCEVDLCGHATIATFYTLAKEGYISPMKNGVKTVYQYTKSGKLAVEICFENRRVTKIFMEQGIPRKLGKIQDILPLSNSMGVSVEDIGVLDKDITPEIISTGLKDIILPIKTKEALDSLTIDKELLSKLSKRLGVVGVHAFYLPELNSEVVYTRNFAPIVGIDEEAATGTSNGALIYFLKENKIIENNQLISFQGEMMNRLSKIYCKIEQNKEVPVIKVGGNAKLIISGTMFI